MWGTSYWSNSENWDLLTDLGLSVQSLVVDVVNVWGAFVR